MDFFAAFVAPAAAQTLSRLHVRDFGMTAAPATLRIGETLRLRIVVRFGDSVTQVDNLTLPDLSGFDSLGDERRCTSARGASECTEVITLSPTVAGDRTIAPATLDAVDATNGKPSHFATNAVTVHVIGAPIPVAQPLFDRLLKPLVILVVVGAAAYALLWGFARRSRAPQPRVPVPPVVPAPDVDPWPELIARLRRDRSRTAVVALREELRRRAGAKDEETLTLLLARRPADPWLNGALRAVERAAFVDDADLAAAIDDALAALEARR